MRLRPLKKCDAKSVISWFEDETSFRKWSADRFEKYPITADELNEYYAKEDYKDSFFAMAAFDKDQIIGQLFMRFVDDDKNILRFGFIVVDPAYRGKGYGKEMLQISLQYAFQILKVKKVTLGVFENNPAAKYCYKSVGFNEAKKKELIKVRLMDEDWILTELEHVGEGYV